MAPARETKEARLEKLIALQQEIHEEDIQKHVGREHDVLIDSVSIKEQGRMSGRTDGFRPVSVQSDTLEIGDTVRVKINAASGHWLYGDVLSESPIAT